MILILYQICFLDLLARFGRCAALLVVLLVGLCPSPSLIIATEATTSMGRLDRLLPQISLQLWHSRPSNTWNWWLVHEEGNQSWFPKSPMKSDKKQNQHLQVVNIWVFPKIGVPPKHPKMIIFSRKTHGCWVPPFKETPILVNNIFLTSVTLGSKASKVTLTTPSSKRICQSEWLSEGVHWLNPTADGRNPAPPGMSNNGINYLLTGAGILPSTVWYLHYRPSYSIRTDLIEQGSTVIHLLLHLIHLLHLSSQSIPFWDLIGLSTRTS